MLAKQLLRVAPFASIGIFAITAHAARLGHPGVSAKQGSGGPTQWALLSDPDGATDGKTSTIYQTKTEYGQLAAELVEVVPQYPYSVTDVEVLLSNGHYASFHPDLYGEVFIKQNTFGRGVVESGVVQVSWSLLGATPPDYGTDDNTHTLLFDKNPNSTLPGKKATFTDTMLYHGFPSSTTPSPDYYEGTFNNKPFYYTTNPLDRTPGHTYVGSNNPSVGESVTLTIGAGNGEGSIAPKAQAQALAQSVPEPSVICLAAVASALGLMRRRR